VLPRRRTACYSAFMQSGRLLYAAADMGVIERGLTWKRAAGALPRLGPEDLLVLEANLAPSLVGRLIRSRAGGARLVFESVSVEKLLRHQMHLHDLYLLSANREELAALRSRLAAGRPRGGVGWLRAFLQDRRIEHLLVPQGPRGARLYRLDARGRLESNRASPSRVVRAPDTTGAGDLLLARVIAALACGRGPARALSEAVRRVQRALQRGKL